jgi:hypothetical protein
VQNLQNLQFRQLPATDRKAAVLRSAIECLFNRRLCSVDAAQVYGLPTLIVFKDGKEVADSKTEGALTKAKLADYIKKYATAKVSA